jgi:hypothetical protein
VCVRGAHRALLRGPSTSPLDLMTDYSAQWSRYRRLRQLTFLPLVGCFAFVALLGSNLNEKLHPILWGVAGAVDVVCFLTFCFNGLKLSRFRCPRCSSYFSRGKKTHLSRPSGMSCRHCGLRLYAEV